MNAILFEAINDPADRPTVEGIGVDRIVNDRNQQVIVWVIIVPSRVQGGTARGYPISSRS